MKTDDVKKVRLLSDKPTDGNQFAHDKTARAISDLILDEDGGKTIALTGHWGSGKSSIVEMIKLNLKKNCDVFVFDAWVHEGDPLRRSFLESIIQHMLERGYPINKDTWTDILDELSKRRESLVTKESIEPTNLGLTLLASTIIAPLGLVLLSLWDRITWPVLILAIIISSIPFVVFLFFSIKYLRTKEKEKRKKIALLLNQSDKTTTSTTFRMQDPTSIEFQKYFFLLMDEAFKTKEQKFLIVIDNLDRIEDTDALKIWATMRTFFDFEKASKKNWYTNTWLLVPYDLSGLKKLWNNERADDCLATSFTEKTFQISFETPLPIISDSNKFFREQFTLAFNDLTDDKEIHKIYRIFKAHRNHNILSPTPREIKLFINNLTSVYRQWEKLVPLHIQALYILLRKSKWIEDKILLENLLNHNVEFLDQTLKEIVDRDYREYLAGLYFNVDKDKAYQILLRESLEKALIKPDLDYLEKNKNLPGFTEICEDIIAKEASGWANNETNTLASATFSISTLKLTEDNNLKNTWQHLKHAFSNIRNWKSISETSQNGICAIIERESSEQFSELIIKSFSSSPMLFENKKENTSESLIKDKEEIKVTIGALAKVMRLLKQLGHNNTLETHFRINSSAGTYNELILELSTIQDVNDISKYFVSNLKPVDIIADESSKIQSGMIVEINRYQAFKIIYANYKEVNYLPIIDAIKTRLKELNNLKPTEVQTLIHILLYLKLNHQEAFNTLKELTETGFIPNHFALMNSQKQYPAAANCLYCILTFVPSGSLVSLPGQANLGMKTFQDLLTAPSSFENILDCYIDILLEFSEINNVFHLSEVNKNIESFKNQLTKHIGRLEHTTQIISPLQLIENEVQFYNALDKENNEYQLLVNEYVKKTTLISDIQQKHFDKNLASLYIAILQAKEEKDNLLVEFLKKGLNSLSKEDWEKEISLKHDNALHLVIKMVQWEFPPALKSPFMDVLISAVDATLEGKVIQEILEKNWGDLIKSLDKDHKKTLLGKIRYKINNYDKDLSKVFALFGEELIINPDIFIEDIDDVVREGFIKIINRRIIEELSWLVKLLEANPTILSKCDQNYLKAFKDRLSRIIKDENPDENLLPIYKKLANLLKIETTNESEQTKTVEE